VTAKSALRLLLQPAGLGAVFEHGAVVIRNREALSATMTHRVYDVRSALRKLQDFPAPELGFRPQFAGCCFLGIFTNCDGGHGCPLEDLLVRENTGDRSWDTSPRAAIQLIDGRLYVTQTPRVLREIENLLRRLPF